MSRHNIDFRKVVVTICGLLVLLTDSVVHAQAGGFFGKQQAVGGSSVDADGVLRNSNIETRKTLRGDLTKLVKNPSGELTQPVGFRMISLKGLEAAIAAAHQNNN